MEMITKGVGTSKVPAPFATMCVAVYVSNNVHLYYEFFCELEVNLASSFFRDSISASFAALSAVSVSILFQKILLLKFRIHPGLAALPHHIVRVKII